MWRDMIREIWPNRIRHLARRQTKKCCALGASQALSVDRPAPAMAGFVRVWTAAAVVVATQLLALTTASIYPIESNYWVPPFQRAEKMFATDNGPIFAHDGNSTITVRVCPALRGCCGEG